MAGQTTFLHGVLEDAPTVQYDVFDYDTQRNLLFGNVKAALEKRFPLANDRYTLHLKDLDYDTKDDTSLKAQKEAILTGGTVTRRLRGRWELTDNATGDRISKSNRRVVMRVPYMTERGTFIRNGHEMVVGNILRLQPGVYTRQKANGKYEAHVNVQQGTGDIFKVFMDPATGVFNVHRRGRGMRLYPLLRAYGITDEELNDTWGKELVTRNRAASSGSLVARSHTTTFGKQAQEKDQDDVVEYVSLSPEQAEVMKADFGKMQLDPEATSLTLGKPYAAVDGQMLKDTATKLLRLSQGKVQPDNRDSLEFQRVYSSPELFADRVIRDGGRIARNLLWKATNKGNLDFLPAGALDPHIDGVFRESRLAQYVEGSSPMDLADTVSRITRIGEGGIASLDATPLESRLVQHSYHGFIDPVRSPESSRVGVDTYLAQGVRKGSDGQLYNKFVNPRTGKMEWVSAKQASVLNITTPDQLVSGNKYVAALDPEGVRFVKREDIDLVVPHPDKMFSLHANLVPLKSSSKAMRMNMGCLSVDTMILIVRSSGEIYYGPVGEYDHREGDKAYAVDAATGVTSWRIVRALVPNNSPGTLLEVTLKSGRRLCTTANHKWVTLSDDGTLVPILAANLRVGMPVPCAGQLTLPVCVEGPLRVGSGEKHNSFPGFDFTLTQDTGYLIGMYLSEGCLTSTNRGRWSGLHLAVDCDEMRERVIRSMRELGLQPHERAFGCAKGTGSPHYSVVVHHTGFAGFLADHFKHGSAKKAIPGWVLASPEDFRRGVLAGYLDGDGCVTLRRGVARVTGGTRSKLLSEGLQLMCSTLGLDTTLSVRAVTEKPFYQFSIRAGSVADIPRLENPFKRGRLEQAKAYGGARNEPDWIPVTPRILGLVRQVSARKSPVRHRAYIDTLSRRSLAGSVSPEKYCWLGSSVIWDRIKEVRLCGDAEKAFDLDLDDGIFMAGVGVFVHNSKYSSQAVPLVNREVPLVQNEGETGPVDSTIGHLLGIRKAPVDGVVKSIGRDKMVITTPDGDTPVELYDDFPVNQKGYLRNIPQVKVGDQVRKGALLATTNYTDDKGNGAMGANMRVGYISWRGLTFEDNIVVSESAARKLTSEHMFSATVPKEKTIILDKNRFMAAFPGKYSKDQLAKIGPNGLPKAGTRLDHGDPMVLAVRENAPAPGSMGRSTLTNMAQSWEHDTQGVVIGAKEGKQGHSVYVRTNSPLRDGDKIAGRSGNKGVVLVLPDDQMPVRADGKPLEVLMSPLGLITRTNPSQVLEALIGKVAEKNGKPLSIPSFSGHDMVDWTDKLLKKNGLSDTEYLLDPEDGHKIPEILTGNSYFYKLKHTAEAKESGRGSGHQYTIEELPGSGGYEGSKRLGNLEQSALMGHGALNFVKDAKLIRGQKNDDFWRDFRMGRTPVMPGEPLVHKKLYAHLRGAGINIRKQKDRIDMFGATEKDMRELGGSRELKSTSTFNSKTFEPIDSGLFGKDIFGPDGTQWGFIQLDEPIPNPIMEDSLRRTLNMKVKDFRAAAAGTIEVDGKRGGEALLEKLRKIDMPGELRKELENIRNGKGQKRDDAIKRYRALASMKQQGLDPVDFMLTRIPVIPPVFRPVTTSGSMTMIPDSNYLYKRMMEARDDLRDAKAALPDEQVAEARGKVYSTFKQLAGLESPDDIKLQKKNVGGLLEWVFGKGSPKYGGFQRKIATSSLDTVGRGTVTPNPSLKLNQIGLPEEQAWAVYEPFIVRQLVGGGYPTTEAVKMVAERHPGAREAMLKVTETRPVVMTRAPVLHKFGIMGFWPVLTKGSTLQVSPSIVEPYNMDFDGDNANFHVPVSQASVNDVIKRMMPEKNLFNVTKFQPHYLPIREYQQGLYLATKLRKGQDPVKFKTAADAKQALRDGKIEVDTPVRIG